VSLPSQFVVNGGESEATLQVTLIKLVPRLNAGSGPTKGLFAINIVSVLPMSV